MIFAFIAIGVLILSFVIALVSLVREQNQMLSLQKKEDVAVDKKGEELSIDETALEISRQQDEDRRKKLEEILQREEEKHSLQGQEHELDDEGPVSESQSVPHTGVQIADPPFQKPQDEWMEDNKNSNELPAEVTETVPLPWEEKSEDQTVIDTMRTNQDQRSFETTNINVQDLGGNENSPQALDEPGEAPQSAFEDSAPIKQGSQSGVDLARERQDKLSGKIKISDIKGD